ncbi:uncharacterized protein LOC106174321 [Lingula anatina]|uniref:Uncharacterized protein LOC106174321 n=1 Tax=Lingula anatina TaxID=7574 RepID=A0A2R2MJP7_LINAN|nr:uncharacterized protein LOC106174321 [Lingula anatina]|eukprot:XP_023930430.1 uncharacterized protein LOC106174321 [Lingula anatina]
MGYQQTGQECIRRRIESACTTNQDCSSAVTNSECANNVCACNAGFYSTNARTTCLGRRIGDSCTNDVECSRLIENSACYERKCGCIATYYASDDNSQCFRRLRDWEIALIALGALLFLVLLALLICCCCFIPWWGRRGNKKKQKTRKPLHPPEPRYVAGPVPALAPPPLMATMAPAALMVPYAPPSPLPEARQKSPSDVFVAVPDHFVAIRKVNGRLALARVEAADYLNHRIMVNFLSPIPEADNMFELDPKKEIVSDSDVAHYPLKVVRRGEYFQLVTKEI